ncbi:hypothetical protein PMAYCL1PPCAC_25823 [Pristionchus mayeri]|uniref:Uncharacterized protein n=1 Tax=Pristionchus mayeri TaxID=1317129 RepID=A0AAN5D319_9BILA|nr:hypothetical protein PMAYCL1PPCAC_25823 [Pristionchus mayeri]
MNKAEQICLLYTILGKAVGLGKGDSIEEESLWSAAIIEPVIEEVPEEPKEDLVMQSLKRRLLEAPVLDMESVSISAPSSSRQLPPPTSSGSGSGSVQPPSKSSRLPK